MRNKEAGLTLIEVVIAVAILAVVFSMTVSAMLSSYDMSTRSRQDALALAAAQDMVAQIRTAQPNDVANNFAGLTFTVDGLPPPVVGGVAVPHGEVIVIADETPDEAAYGRDLLLPPGPDGIDLDGNGLRWDILTVASGACPFPVDLDGSLAVDNDAVLPDDMTLVPVVVVVSWESKVGLSRVQLLTFVVDRDGF
ncbi:MAG: PulJ/GspJ family protein [Planctomycetota bacterium]|jgi:prepilin-type N-terminal cleavage/methylation domain-containing protein